MSLDIRLDPQPAGLIADRRLYLNSENKIVEEGNAAAAYLLATPGWAIPAEECKRLGLSLKDGKVVQGYEEPAPEKPKRKKAG